MLVLRPITAGQSRYYLESPTPGRWVGAGSQDLGLRGTADPVSLPAVLGGRRPDGELLLARLPAGRRSGFDLIFAAPKSVSLLGALGGDEHQGRFRGAHEQAVAATVGYLERQAAWARRGREGRRIPTSGLVAVAFAHSRSAALDPHLHTHVVVANLAHGDDGRWSCLDSRSLYRHAGAAGAVFQAALRYHLAEQGLHFDWRISRFGLGDIVGVPRSAIDAASLRHREVTDEIEAGMAGKVGRATAAGRSRGAVDRSLSGGASSVDARWRERVAAAGLDQQGAQRLLMVAAGRRLLSAASPARGPDPAAMTRRLSEQHSQFRRPDVVRAAAAVSAGGARAATLEDAADVFLKSAVPAGGDVWTTVDLRRLEERILAAAPAGPSKWPVGLASPQTPPPEGLSDTGREAVDRLIRGGAPVDVVGGVLLSQAAVLDAARTAWEASGHRVAIVSQTERGQARWRALAALEPPPPAPGHATVVVVDNAERWPTSDLHRVTADATARLAKVVLLDGGTAPRRRRAESPAFEALRQTLPVIDAGPVIDTASPTGVRPISDAWPLRHPVVEAGRDATVIVAGSGRAAMDHVVSDWHRRRLAGERPRMVALGPEEAEHLNAMARAIRIRTGELSGPSVEIGGRSYRAGDEVAALRRDPRLGRVGGGTVGRITAVDAEHHAATIRWDGTTESVTVATSEGRSHPGQAGSLPLTHAYATTPPYLRRAHDGPILSLGHVEAVAPHLHPDRVYDVVAAPRAESFRRQVDPLAGLLAQLRGQLDRPAPAPPLPAPLPTPSGRPTSTIPSDVGRPLSELVVEWEQLAEHLRASLPPDSGPELRRLREERESLLSIPYQLRRPDQVAALTTLESRRVTLTAAAGDRAQWLERHRSEIERWGDLTNAVVWREAALGRGAEVRPSVAVREALGSPPQEHRDRQTWRRAAEAIEAHRDRWGLPDEALALADETTAVRDVTRRTGELSILAASQELQRTRQRTLGRGQDRSPTRRGL